MTSVTDLKIEISRDPTKAKVNMTKFWRMDPNLTFVFCYISHYHMEASKYFLSLCGIYSLKDQRNTLEIHIHV